MQPITKYILTIILILISSSCGPKNSSNLGHPLADRHFEDIVSIDKLSQRLVSHIDRNYIKVPSSSLYSQRLARLMEDHQKIEERRFNFRVYLSPEVEILGMPNGAIRISSGLMDMFTDQELIWLLIHEQYHAMYGDSREVLVEAYKSLFGTKDDDDLTKDELGSLIREFAQRPYSIAQTLAADAASMQAIKEASYDLDAAPSALFKLAVLGNNHTLTAKQPEAQKRAQKLLVKNLINSGPEQAEQANFEPQNMDMEATTVDEPPAPEIEPSRPRGVEVDPALIREQNWQLRTGWYIELEAFADRIDSETLGEKYRAKNISHHTAKVVVDQDEIYLSLLGPYFEYAVAQEVLEELRNSGELRREVRVLHVGH